MDYQSLHIKTVVELRGLARDMGLRIPAGTNKSTLIDMLLEADRKARAAGQDKPAAQAPAPEKPVRRRGRPLKQENRAEAAPVAAKPAESKPEKAPAVAKTAEAKPEKAPAVAKTAEAGPAKAPSGARPSEAPVGEAPRPVVRGRTAVPLHFVPRPAADIQVRPGKGRGGQDVGGRRVAQGDARTPRQAGAQVGAQAGTRPSNPRFQRQGDVQRRPAQPAAASPKPDAALAAEGERQRPEGYYNAEYRTANPAVPEMLAAGECGDGAGVLEIQPDGYGFLRAENCLPGPNDVYISIAQIRRFELRNGDRVVGKTRAQREGDRYSAMMYITEVNGESPEKAMDRPRFEDLVPIYPDQRLRLESPGGRGDLSLRLIDMLAPIGKGQRGMIVSQPKAGKTTLLKKVANAITSQYPDVHLIVLLIDERPEEVTDMQRSIKGEVIYSTFDEEPEHHTRVSEMVLARAQRLVETGKDVVVLLDSITRLARAYNLTITPTGRSLSGGLDPGALFKPKRFFGAARNIENGGSLTIIATALVETGSRMDDIIFEEFKGTGNMELHLDRKLSDRRVFPAIDLLKSGTRREELLLTEEEMNGEYQVRRMLNGRQQEMYEQLIELMTRTVDNADFFTRRKGWLAVYEKEGYSLGR